MSKSFLIVIRVPASNPATEEGMRAWMAQVLDDNAEARGAAPVSPGIVSVREERDNGVSATATVEAIRDVMAVWQPATVDVAKAPAAPVSEAAPPMHKVDSSRIRSIGYIPGSKKLRVSFIGKGNTGDALYEYDDVTERMWDALQTAKSKGVYLAANIEGKHTHRRLA